MQALIKSIRADANYLKFKKILERVQKAVNLEADTNEALSLHASRTSRSLTGNDRYNPMTLIDANLKDLSFRARLVELRVKNDIKLSMLREATDAMKRHVSTEYVEDLKEFSTADQRKAFTDRVVKSAKEFLAEGDSFLSTVDLLIKDIDQCNYSMKSSIECLKLLAESKGSRVV